MRNTFFHQIMRPALGVALFGAAALSTAACGDVARTGRSPAFIIIDSMEGSAGGESTFSSILMSDVQTLVDSTVNGQTVQIATIFNDIGRATLRLALKNPGTAASPTAASTLNEITITRYRVRFQRADGRNTPGVDVPYGFDGALTATIPASGSVTVAFDLVRHQNKLEPPLSNMPGFGAAQFFSTLAEVTFFGQDQAGNEVSATGFISVNFGDFADE